MSSLWFTLLERRYTRVPDIILNKIYPATEWHDVRGPTHLEKDIFPTLKGFLIFFPSVKNTIHLIVELQPQTSIKKEKEKALSSACIRIVRWQAKALPDEATIKKCFLPNSGIQVGSAAIGALVSLRGSPDTPAKNINPLEYSNWQKFMKGNKEGHGPKGNPGTEINQKQKI